MKTQHNKWIGTKRLSRWVRRRKQADIPIVPPAAVIMLATLASRALGIIREMIFATKFGAPPELDAYQAAFQLPDLLTRVFVIGAFSSAFIPVFARYLEEKRDADAWRLANIVTTLLISSLVVLSLLIFFLAPFITPLIAPGFDPIRREYMLIYLRIMLLSPIFLGMSTVLSSILNSHHKFTAAAYAPVAYNLGIIAGAVVFEPMVGMIWGLGLGVALGAFLHFALQVYPVLKLGFRYKFDTDINFRGVKEVIKLGVPRMIGLGVAQLDMFVDIILGSFLPVGSIALLNYANRLQSLPVGIFGASVATACFPVFVRKAATDDNAALNKALFRSLKHVLFFAIPASVMLVVMRVEVIRLLFGQAGKLNWFETRSVAFALALYAISIFAQSSIYVLSRAFYALKDTKTPVVAALFSVALNSVLSIILVFTVHHFSMLALSYTMASLVNMILLLVMLQYKIGGFQMNSFFACMFRIVSASAIMGFITWLVENWLSNTMDLTIVSNLVIETGAAVGVGGLVYIALIAVFGGDELKIFGRFLKTDETCEMS